MSCVDKRAVPDTHSSSLQYSVHVFLSLSLSLSLSHRGADFYPGVNSLGYGGKGKVSKAGIDRMVADLDQQ